MPRVTVCGSCGETIRDYGWRAFPAVVEDGELVGVTAEGEVVGEGIDLCVTCCPKKHPALVTEGEGDD